MPVITSIKSQKNKKRVNIYLDDKFGFGIDLENFLKLGLKVDQELSDEEVEKIVKKAEFQKTLDKLLRFATLRPRSEKEIKDWLKGKKVHQSIHNELFYRLKRLELVDDEKFASWWVEQRINFRPKAKRAMEYELKNKGIEKSIIKSVLSGLEYDEAKVAKEMLGKVESKWERLDKRTRNQKAARYLAGKGFGWDVIKSLLSVDQEM